MINNKTVSAVIPVRKGSRRLKNKNVAPFADSNLLINKIRQLKQVPEIDNIYVSSDSDKMLKMSKDEGGVNIHKRAKCFADEISTTFGDTVKHVAENIDGDIMMCTPCVVPLVVPSVYSAALQDYSKYVFLDPDSDYDSLATLTLHKHFLWNEKGPINYKLGKAHVASQDLPNLYVMTFAISIAPREKMIEWHYLHGPNPYKFIIPKIQSVDIDDELDLEQAKAWYKLMQIYNAD